MDYFAHLETWIGTPYVHQGHSRDGVDCIGLVRAAYAEYAIDLSPYDIPERALKPNTRQLLRGLRTAFPSPASLTVGTVLGIRDHMTGACHVTLYRAKMGKVYEVVEACRERGFVVRNYYPDKDVAIYTPSTEQIHALSQQRKH